MENSSGGDCRPTIRNTSCGRWSDVFLADVAPYALGPVEKSSYLMDQLRTLLAHHRQHCPEYGRLVLDWEEHRADADWTLEEYPFVPVTAFKEFELKSTVGEVV